MSVTTIARTVSSGVELTELTYAAGTRLPRHAHDRAGFCLVLDGTYVEGYGARDLQCRAQTVTFSPAGEEHRNVFGAGPVHCFTIDVSKSLLDPLERPMRDPFEQQGGKMAMLAERLLIEFRDSDDVSPLAIEGLVLEMMAAAGRASRQRDEVRASDAIRRVRELLETRFAEPLQLVDIASAVDRHPVYVATSFRRAYGETIGGCVRRLRLEFAREELARAELPIAEIALRAGFSDQSHLTRAFTKAMGMPPAAYRTLIAGKPH